MIEFACQPPVETETGWTIAARLEAESEYLRGHFPARPILPAVAQLALLTQATRSAWDRDLSLLAINDLRFRQPLFPGAELELRVGPRALDEDTRFGIYLDGKPVSQGSVRWTDTGLPPVLGFESFSPGPASGPPILLPQADEARYIHECLSSDDSGLECAAFVPAGNPFRTETRQGSMIPSFLALELGAQAAATHEGVLRAAGDGEAEAVGGYVVRCRQAAFETTLLPADARFEVAAKLLEAAPPLRTYEVAVGLGERTLVRGLVSTFAG